MSAAPMQLDLLAVGALRSRWPAWLWLAAALCGLALLLLQASAVQEERDELLARNDLLQARLRPARAQRSAPGPEELRRIERANRVIDELVVPWGDLFRAVESAETRSVGLLSLVPNAKDRTLRLSGETRSVPELLAYVDRVAAQPALGQVHLLGYETAARDGAQVISFTLAATWKPR